MCFKFQYEIFPVGEVNGAARPTIPTDDIRERRTEPKLAHATTLGNALNRN